jgi:hypothetical protein
LCAYTSIERWLSKKKSILLEDRHFHVVFTIPHQLNPLWQYNVKAMTKIFFSCVRSTLFDLLDDQRFLGGTPGVIATIHTWSRTMMLHPHIHCLVTGGGLSKQGQWVGANNGYLLPYRVVRKLFSGRFIDAIRKGLHDEQLTLPPDMSKQKLDNLLNKLGRIHWSVHLRHAYKHGHGVATYLSRYMRGGPLSSKRILSYKDNIVRLNYGRKTTKAINLSGVEFINRFLQHVPPSNLVCVRNWGLYHHSQKEKLAICYQQIGQTGHNPEDFLTWQLICSRSGDRHPELCPHCGRRLTSINLLYPTGRLKFPNLPDSNDLDSIAIAA